MNTLVLASYILAVCAVLTAISYLFIPNNGPWDKLGKFIIIALITGAFCLVSSLCGILSWDEGGLPIQILTVITAIPGIGAAIMAVMLLNK